MDIFMNPLSRFMIIPSDNTSFKIPTAGVAIWRTNHHRTIVGAHRYTACTDPLKIIAQYAKAGTLCFWQTCWYPGFFELWLVINAQGCCLAFDVVLNVLVHDCFPYPARSVNTGNSGVLLLAERVWWRWQWRVITGVWFWSG